MNDTWQRYQVQGIIEGWAWRCFTLYTFIIPEQQAGRRLSSILSTNHGMSRRLLRKLTVDDAILVNGEHVRLSLQMNEGDCVAIRFPEEQSSVNPESIPIDICYEDENVIVVNKPVGMLTHPSARERTGSLLAAAAYYLQSKNLVPHSIHRLDKYTSGAILVAKHAHAHHLFDEAIRNGLIHRHYVALVYAPQPVELASQRRMLDFIAQDPTKPSRRIIGDQQNGQVAITYVEALAAVPPVYVCRFRLETGRTHQIRLQMASRGMPLLGDRDYTYAYSGEDVPRTYAQYQRVIPHQALHAYELLWQTKLQQNEEHVFAPVRGELEELWSYLGGEISLSDLVSQRPFGTLVNDA